MTRGLLIPQLFREMLALPPEGSTYAGDVDALHLFIITTTIVGSVAVAVVTLYFILRYRRKTPYQLTPAISARLPFELLTIAGTLGLFIMWWVIGYKQYVAIEVPPDDALIVYVQAKQWMWKFSYADGRSTNDVLVVPANRNVRLLMTSRDVIHSFYVPGFRMKQDVIPGRYVSAWFRSPRPDTYPIYCAEYCGTSHSMMRGSVLVLGDEDYDAWLNGRPLGNGGRTLAEAGRDAAIKHACVACHTFDGQPHIGPTWSRLYGSTVALDGGRTVMADPEYLTRSMMEPDVDVVSGYKPVMPAGYRYTLPAADAAAIVEFIRSLKDGPITPEVQLPTLRIEAVSDAGTPEQVKP